MTSDDTLNLLIAFVQDSMMNSTQWRDPDGGRHNCFDVHSVIDYLYELKQYVINVGGMEEFARLWKESLR